MFRALNHRNYRLFFVGQTISLIGTWMDSIAMTWLVFSMTHSPVLLGTVALFNQIPAFFLSPFAGVWLDMWDRRRLLIITQSISAVFALLLAFLVYTNQVLVWHICAIALILGLVSAFDMPGRQAFMVEIVDNRDDLSNAIALNSSQFNIARLIGPPIAGVLIHLVGTATCFLINGISFVAVIGALAAMKVLPREMEKKDRNVLRNLREGWNYSIGFPAIWTLLVMLGMMSFSGGMYYVLMPIYATDVFNGNEQTLGFLYGAVGVGALSGALLLASRKSIVGISRFILMAASIYGIAFITFGFNHVFLVALALLAAAGFGMMVHMASTNTLLQSLLDDHMRGRVMSFYTMSFLGTMPMGSFVAGHLTPIIGPSGVMWVAGTIAITSAILMAFVLPRIRGQARDVLQEKGLYPVAQPPMAPQEMPATSG